MTDKDKLKLIDMILSYWDEDPVPLKLAHQIHEDIRLICSKEWSIDTNVIKTFDISISMTYLGSIYTIQLPENQSK